MRRQQFPKLRRNSPVVYRNLPVKSEYLEDITRDRWNRDTMTMLVGTFSILALAIVAAAVLRP